MEHRSGGGADPQLLDQREHPHLRDPAHAGPAHHGKSPFQQLRQGERADPARVAAQVVLHRLGRGGHEGDREKLQGRPVSRSQALIFREKKQEEYKSEKEKREFGTILECCFHFSLWWNGINYLGETNQSPPPSQGLLIFGSTILISRELSISLSSETIFQKQCWDFAFLVSTSVL